MGAKLFGARVKRLEDPALLTGRGCYVDDIKLPDMLYAAFVRSPHPHARIRSIDKAPALSSPGVHSVYTLADLPKAVREQQLLLLLPNPAISQPMMPHVLAGAPGPLSPATAYWPRCSASACSRSSGIGCCARRRSNSTE